MLVALLACGASIATCFIFSKDLVVFLEVRVSVCIYGNACAHVHCDSYDGYDILHSGLSPVWGVRAQHPLIPTVPPPCLPLFGARSSHPRPSLSAPTLPSWCTGAGGRRRRALPAALPRRVLLHHTQGGQQPQPPELGQAMHGMYGIGVGKGAPCWVFFHKRAGLCAWSAGMRSLSCHLSRAGRKGWASGLHGLRAVLFSRIGMWHKPLVPAQPWSVQAARKQAVQRAGLPFISHAQLCNRGAHGACVPVCPCHSACCA